MLERACWIARKLGKLIVVLYLVVFALWLPTCAYVGYVMVRDGIVPPPIIPTDPAVEGITYVNETDEPLQFYDGLKVASNGTGDVVEPHSKSFHWSSMMGKGTRIEAKRLDGKKVFEHTYTWQELEEVEGRVVVSSLEPIE